MWKIKNWERSEPSANMSVVSIRETCSVPEKNHKYISTLLIGCMTLKYIGINANKNY